MKKSPDHRDLVVPPYAHMLVSGFEIFGEIHAKGLRDTPAMRAAIASKIYATLHRPLWGEIEPVRHYGDEWLKRHTRDTLGDPPNLHWHCEFAYMTYDEIYAMYGLTPETVSGIYRIIDLETQEQLFKLVVREKQDGTSPAVINRIVQERLCKTLRL